MPIKLCMDIPSPRIKADVLANLSLEFDSNKESYYYKGQKRRVLCLSERNALQRIISTCQKLEQSGFNVHIYFTDLDLGCELIIERMRHYGMKADFGRAKYVGLDRVLSVMKGDSVNSDFCSVYKAITGETLDKDSNAEKRANALLKMTRKLYSTEKIIECRRFKALFRNRPS